MSGHGFANRRRHERVAIGSAAPVTVALETHLGTVAETIRGVSLSAARVALDAPTNRIHAGMAVWLRLGEAVVSVTIRHVDVSRPWEPSCGVRFDDGPGPIAEFVAAVAAARS